MITSTLKVSALGIALAFSATAVAQEKVIDKVIAVVGSNPILKSELEAQYQHCFLSFL